MNISECWYKGVCNYKKCNSSCIRYLEMQYLTSNSGIPQNRQYPILLSPEKQDYSNFCLLAEIKDNIISFVHNGQNLYICSQYPGNGKTSWAIKLMMKYFDEVWAGNGFRVRGLFIHVPTFLNQLKDFNNVNVMLDNVKSMLPNVDLVIWDDIASTGISQYDHSQLLTYIDQRILAKKSNIFTSNIISQQNLQSSIGSRLASRVYSTSQIITFNGGDRRNE